MTKTLLQLNQFHDESPLGLYSSWPTADAKLNFYDSSLVGGTGAKKVIAPVSKQVFSALAGVFINFQTQALSNAAHFDITWPVTNIVGRFRRVGFTLVGSGKIKVLFSNEFVTEGALPDAGTVLVSGGNPLGYIDLECTNILGYFKTAASATSIIESGKIYRFGSGAGGGSGGGLSSILSDLKAQQEETNFGWLESNIFETDTDTKITSTTGIFNIVDNAYAFTVGQNLISWSLLDIDFIDSLDDIQTVAVALTFKSGAVDTAPAVTMSRNGGGEYQALTLERLSANSDTYYGNLTFAQEAAYQALHTYAVGNADGTLAINATTLQSYSQAFTASVENEILQQITLYLAKTESAGTLTGYLKINLYEDSAGVPGAIKSQNLVNTTSLSIGNNVVPVVLGGNVLKYGVKYHVGIETDADYKASYSAGVRQIAVRADTSAPGVETRYDATTLAVPAAKSYNGSVWADVAGSSFVYLLEGRILKLFFKYTASMTSSLLGYGVFYGPDAESYGRLQKRAAFAFNGTLDTATYNLGFQLPWDADPDFLEVKDIFSGQSWQVPAFELQNNKVVFPANFWDGQQAVQIIARQVEAGSYDGNPELKKLLTENHLASADPAITKGVAGRGPQVLTETTSIRVEITVDADYNVIIKEA